MYQGYISDLLDDMDFKANNTSISLHNKDGDIVHASGNRRIYNSARQVGLYLSQAWKLEERPS